MIKIRRVYQELFYFSFSLVDLKSTFQCCFLWPLPLGFTYSHLSIGTATHSMKATDWMRRWVRVKRVLSTPCVCFLPCLLEYRGRRWASDDSPPPLSPWWSQILPLMHCLNQHLPSSVWSFVSSFFSYLYAVFGLCGLEKPIGEMCSVCCSPVFKVKTSDAFTVAIYWDSIGVFRMHHIDLEEAQHFKFIKAQQRIDVLKHFWHIGNIFTAMSI